MEPSYLHSDIIFQILLRTSSETLARCRLASKEWNQMTYDSKFKKVRSQKTNIVDGFFVQELNISQYVTSFASFSGETHKFSLDFIPGFDIRVIAVSANSRIVLCTSDNHTQYPIPCFFVCKPQVELSQQIPNPKTRFSSLGVAISVLCSNPFRYKIVRISSPITLMKNCQQLILEVFDSRAWQWKRLKNILLPYHVWFFIEMTVVAACGAFHWLVHTGLIFSFDIEKEEWKIKRLPVVEDDYITIDMAKYEGKLALMCMDIEGYMHTWILESYINEVWKKRFVINIKELGSTYVMYRPLAFYGSDIIVVRGSSSFSSFSSLKYYDFKNEKLLNESKPGIYYFSSDIFPFSPNSEPCCLREGREHDIQCWSRGIASMESSAAL